MGPVEEATPQQGIADETTMAQAYGIDKPQFQRTRKAMDATTADYESRKQDRGLETFISTMGGAARGYGGTSAGYLDAKRAQRGQDDAYLKQMLDLERGIEGDELGLTMDRYTGAGTHYGKRQDVQQEREKSRVGVAKDIATQDAQRRENETDRAFQERMKALDRANTLAAASMRSSGGGGGGGGSGKLTAKERLQVQELRTRRTALQKEADKTINRKAKAELQAQVDAISAQIAEYAGRDEPAGAAPPVGTQSTAVTKGTPGWYGMTSK
jgi:hypothetical protein